MKPKNLAMITVASLALTTSVNAIFTLTGVYDSTKATDDANNVDQSATFASGSAGSRSVIDLAKFKPLVEKAFNEGKGGVISFDQKKDALDMMTPNNTLTTSVFGNSKLTFNGPGDGGLVLLGRGMGSGNRIPTSGRGRLGLTGGKGTFEFNDFVITGAPTGTGLTAFGFTLIHRQTDATFTASATFSDGTNVVFDPVTFTKTDPANTLDTFFGIMAPYNETITSVSISRVGGSNSWIDDIGFITSSLPELSTDP